MTAAARQSDTHPLAGALAQWTTLNCDVGLLDADWMDLGALAHMPAVELEALLAIQALNYPGLDRRGQAAFVLGTFSWALCNIFAMLHLSDLPLPDAGPNSVGVKFVADESLPGGQRLDFRISQIAPLRDHSHGDRLTVLPGQIEMLHVPLVGRLLRDTRLSRAAQWRLVADSLAGAFLHVGQQMQRAETAQADALAMLAPGRSLLSNRQTGYIQASISSGNDAHCQTFLSRGGCCRYYTAEGGEYCITCVLRKPEDQKNRLRAYLLESLEQ